MKEVKVIQVKVAAHAKENKVMGFQGEILKVRCTAPREEGKANAAVTALLAKYFNVPQANVCLLRGATATLKLFEITFC